MAIESLSILTSTNEGKQYLAEAGGIVVENLASEEYLSNIYKNHNIVFSDAGTVIVDKVSFTGVNKLGTARSTGKASNIKTNRVKVDLDDDIEILHEVSDKDVKTYGNASALVDARFKNDTLEIAQYKENKFWEETCNKGVAFTPSAQAVTYADKADEAIVALQSYKSDEDGIAGVPMNRMGLVLSPAGYAKLRKDIDEIKNHANENTYKFFHGVRVDCCTNMPEGKDAVVVAFGATAQPYIPLECPAGMVPMSTDHYFGLAGSMGTKTLTPGLIRVINNFLGDKTAE